MPKEPLTLSALVEAASLLSIGQYELSAERAAEPETIDESAPLEPIYGLNIDFRKSGDGFRVRLSTKFDTPAGRISSEVGVEYNLENIGARSIPRSVLLEFINNVAIMAMVPYVRQSIADITARVFDSAILMPMIQRGELAFTETDEGP